MIKLEEMVANNFARYAGGVILNRAICDARDMLKPSSRILIYSQKTTTKNTSDKPFVKSARVVGDCLGRWYPHGDAACYDNYMRMSKAFAMRYPLEECQGNNGTINTNNDHASSRYTELRLSKLGDYIFQNIEKDVVTEWEDNFDETEKYPRVAPTPGFYNLVNGTTGIGVSMAASIPSYNLRELNQALIKLLWNEDIDFSEIYIQPDFPTGGLILNGDEVMESHKTGRGKACKIRAIIEYDKTENAFSIKQMPYGVYTSTITEQIKKLVEEFPDCGIESVNDASSFEPNYLIYLSKKANPSKTLKLLYKNTSLEHHYGINFTLLENGRTPKIFTWKEALQAHITHEIEVYTRKYQFDLRKIEERLLIVEGILKALAAIEEVIETIKSSSSTADANKSLCKKFQLVEQQAKAILEMRLSKLAKLEVTKYINEKENLLKQQLEIKEILSDETKLKGKIEEGLQKTAEKFGDDRRTVVINKQEEEIVEQKLLTVKLTNKNNIIVDEAINAHIQNRGGTGTKLKLDKNEFIIGSTSMENTDKLLFFDAEGNFYHLTAQDIPMQEKVAIESLITLKQNSQICAITSLTPISLESYILFVTEKGMLKKSHMSEYNVSRSGGAKAITLAKDDKIVKVLFLNNEKISLLSSYGRMIICRTDDINPIGRITKGIKGIKLDSGDKVVDSNIISSFSTRIVSITEKGYAKQSYISDLNVSGRNTKGVKIQKPKNENDLLASSIAIGGDKDILITSTSNQIKIKLKDIPELGLGAIGVKAISLKEKNKVNNIEEI